MKPILFNTEMVRAIQNGTKTATRRPIKDMDIINAWDCEADGTPIAFVDQATGDSFPPAMPCPYQPGSVLYVRETFKIDYLSNIPGSGRIHYKADDTYGDFTFSPERYEIMRRAQLKPGWRPNENMPREAARIFLRVTDVRVERLQDITDDGIARDFNFCAEALEIMNAQQKDVACMALWDSTINPTNRARYGWEANPFVWVIEFKRCEKPEEPK